MTPQQGPPSVDEVCRLFARGIYLSADQPRRIDRIAAAGGSTMAQVVRRALDEFLDDEPVPGQALAATFDADADAVMPSRDFWHRG